MTTFNYTWMGFWSNWNRLAHWDKQAKEGKEYWDCKEEKLDSILIRITYYWGTIGITFLIFYLVHTPILYRGSFYLVHTPVTFYLLNIRIIGVTLFLGVYFSVIIYGRNKPSAFVIYQHKNTKLKKSILIGCLYIHNHLGIHVANLVYCLYNYWHFSVFSFYF